MDRYGIVSLGPDHNVEALRDGPLPAADGMEALAEAVALVNGGAAYIGELDFNATAPWNHGYYFSPTFGIFSAEGMVCTLGAGELSLPNDERGMIPATDVAGVAVRLSDCWTECHLGLNLHKGDEIRLCTLNLSAFNDQDSDAAGDTDKDGNLLQMNEQATVVWETDWAIKCSAQLTQALRNNGAADAKLGISEQLHAQHNSFAQMRNELYTAQQS